MARSRAIALLLLVPAAIACEQIIGADFGVKRVECGHAQPPLAPAPLVGGSEADILEAVHGVNFGEAAPPESEAGYRSFGFDGDDKCTLLGEGPSCALAKWVEAGISPDGLDGRDNALGVLVASQQTGFGSSPFSSAKVSDEIAKGINPAAAMFRIRRYNGGSRDTEIDVEWLLPANPVADAGAPAWDSTPTFDVVNDSADDGDGGTITGKWRATAAYVANYQLVARFTDVQFRIATIAFPMHTAVLTANLGAAVGRMSNVAIWGVVRMTEMFNLFPDFTRYVTNAPICKSSGLYPIVKGFYCQFTDIRVDGKVDPDVPCDGLSFAVALDTRPAKVGSVVTETRPTYCMPNDDPKGDSCDNPP